MLTQKALESTDIFRLTYNNAVLLPPAYRHVLPQFLLTSL